MSNNGAKQGSTAGGWLVLIVGGLLAYAFVTEGHTPGPAPAASSVVAGIPSNYLALYRANAGKCDGVDAALLAAMGSVESNHGQSPLPGVRSGHNGVGARGPMQFKQAAWSEAGQGAYLPNVYKPGPAIAAAATYLCKYAGVRGSLNGGLLQYGGPGYTGKVNPKAAEYRAAGV